MNYKIILLFFIIFICFYAFNKYFDTNENYESKISILFLSKNETKNNILNNKDRYFDTFFKKDLQVRNVNHIDQYKEIIKFSTCNFNKQEKNKIKQAISNITMKINQLNKNYFKNINIHKLNKIPWILGLICNNSYENGLPHTRNNIILLPKEKLHYYSMKKLEKTLIHEKIHIYQRNYPEEVNYYLNNLGFKKIKKREKNDNIRANPDLDNYIYQDKNHNTYKATYNYDAKSIEDITYYPYDNQRWEHPNEKMAIDFESIITT